MKHQLYLMKISNNQFCFVGSVPKSLCCYRFATKSDVLAGAIMNKDWYKKGQEMIAPYTPVFKTLEEAVEYLKEKNVYNYIITGV